MITQIASDGLNKEWLGKVLDKENIKEFFGRAEEFGFHPGGEGGYFDTLVLDSPLFDRKLRFGEMEKIMESENTGHVVLSNVEIMEKAMKKTGFKQHL